MNTKNNPNISYTQNLVIPLLIITTLGLFFLILYYFTTFKETFINPDQLKAQSAAIPPAPDKICERPGDPSFVSQNYSMCCINNDKSPNCICRLPSIKLCQKTFKDCLNGQIFSPDSRDFLGTENIPAACQKLTDACATGYINELTHTNNPLKNMKPDLSNPDNSICSIDGYKKNNLPQFCHQICKQIPNCKYYQTDTLTSSCRLFKGQPVPLEKGAAAADTLGNNYQLFTMPTEHTPKNTQQFKDTPQPTPNKYATFCMSGAINNCSNKKGTSSQNCLCSHSIIKDCQKLHQNCLKNQSNDTQSCLQQFGACCSIIDIANPNNNASMTPEGKIGNGRQTDILCSPTPINNLSECKSACLQNDQCDFISSNLLDVSNAGSGRKGLTNNGLAPFCYLFKGTPLDANPIMLGQSAKNSKTIYNKIRGNPDEREIDDKLSEK